MKTPERSRFGKLVAYLVNDQGKQTRVGEATITNCVSTDLSLAVSEIVATQQLNTRALSDRAYHLLISLRASESCCSKALLARLTVSRLISLCGVLSARFNVTQINSTETWPKRPAN